MNKSIALAALLTALPLAVAAHDGKHNATPIDHHATFSAGEPGDASQPAQIVKVIMSETDGKMLFVPERLEMKRGDQVKFLLYNRGELDHEFVLASTVENLAHAEQMRTNPDMAHDDPNSKRLAPKRSGEIVWRFTKAGEFEYACLIPGHREAGMIGTVVVK